jgi:hypothetical protein
MARISATTALLVGILYCQTGIASVLYSFDGRSEPTPAGFHVQWDFIAPALLTQLTATPGDDPLLKVFDSPLPVSAVYIDPGIPFQAPPEVETAFTGSTNLYSATWIFAEARSIGFDQPGTYQTYLGRMVISDVPEPSGILIVACCVCGLALFGRPRKGFLGTPTSPRASQLERTCR